MVSHCEPIELPKPNPLHRSIANNAIPASFAWSASNACTDCLAGTAIIASTRHPRPQFALRSHPRLDTCPAKVDTFGRKVNTSGQKLNTFARRVNTLPPRLNTFTQPTEHFPSSRRPQPGPSSTQRSHAYPSQPWQPTHTRCSQPPTPTLPSPLSPSSSPLARRNQSVYTGNTLSHIPPLAPPCSPASSDSSRPGAAPAYSPSFVEAGFKPAS